jgi:hypothetical protein
LRERSPRYMPPILRHGDVALVDEHEPVLGK